MTADITQSRRVDKASQPNGQSIVSIGKTPFGGRDLSLIAGPYTGFFTEKAYEPLSQMAATLSQIGVRCLFGQVFSGQNENPQAGPESLSLLSGVAQQFGMVAITQVASTQQAEVAFSHVDCFLVGPNDMHNENLLKLLGQANRSVILQRNPKDSLQAFLSAAECVLNAGNPNVILCETGLSQEVPQSSDEAHHLLDLGALALLKEMTHLPVIVDSSLGAGQRNLVFPLSRAAIAAGADGLMMEVHPSPLVSTVQQAISADELATMTPFFVPLAFSVGRNLLLEPSG